MKNVTRLPFGCQGQSRHDSLTGKSLITIRHPSGLTLRVLPYPGFIRKFAAAAVPFGSIHTRCRHDRRQVALPSGTAHFLEHCVFSRDDGGGLAGHLAGLGASANAYTTHDHTLYYFSSSDHFEDAFRLWLTALLQPRLDEDRVAAEKPIIQAELSQYQDDPDARCSQILMEGLYQSHPVRTDIGGTASSVASITAQDLSDAFRLFYHPSQLQLTLAGDFDLDSVLGVLDRCLADANKPHPGPAIPIFPGEPELPCQKDMQLEMDVYVPLFMIGVKDPVRDGRASLDGLEKARRQRTARLVLDTLLSPVSPLYDALYRDGLINDSFGCHFAWDASYGFLACGGESEKPAEAADRLRAGLAAACRDGLDERVFAAQKRAAAGEMVQALDSVEHGGMVQARASLLPVDLFDYPSIYDKIDPVQALSQLSFLADPQAYVTALVTPRR